MYHKKENLQPKSIEIKEILYKRETILNEYVIKIEMYIKLHYNYILFIFYIKNFIFIVYSNIYCINIYLYILYFILYHYIICKKNIIFIIIIYIIIK